MLKPSDTKEEDMTDDVSTTPCICFTCVGERYLANEVAKTGQPGTCSYCGSNSVTWSIEELALRIETAFEEHYYLTLDEPTALEHTMMSDGESTYDWERTGLPVIQAIQDAADMSEEVARDIQRYLNEKHANYDHLAKGEETPFSPDTYYEGRTPDDVEWQLQWYTFEKSLKTEARFFSRAAASLLQSVFAGVDHLKTSNGRELILEAGPTLALDHLFRARVFQSEAALKEAMCRPDLHLGPPPTSIAAAGRMNARGISVFYGATEANVAIAEVRPPVGSRVAVARFDIIAPLRLLDLTALEWVHDVGSIFDPSLGKRLARVAFLRSLGRRLTRAVMPDDEAFDYLSTQAIADFLATENDPLFDGIVFRSAQAKDGSNVVLFHKSARVKAMQIPSGVEVEAFTSYDTEDGWEIDYSVTEWVPKSAAEGGDGESQESSWDSNWHRFFDEDERQCALNVDPRSVMIHLVEWVDYKCEAFKVRRNRSTKFDWGNFQTRLAKPILL